MGLVFISRVLSLFPSRRFLLPEYLPYAGIFHERGQPGLATHSSVNRVLAGKHTHTTTPKIPFQVWEITSSQMLISFAACCEVSPGSLFLYLTLNNRNHVVVHFIILCQKTSDQLDEYVLHRQCLLMFPQGRQSGTDSLQSPATSPTPHTVCSGGTSPSLICLKSATVRHL